MKRYVKANHQHQWPEADKIGLHSGLFRAARSSGLAHPTAARRAFQPIRTNLAPALGARFASQLQGKVHQVIGAVVDGMLETPQERRWDDDPTWKTFSRPATDSIALLTVKFDTDQLPPILNALTTQNGGTTLVLEVAVSFQAFSHQSSEANMGKATFG